MLQLDQNFKMDKSTCCECGHELDGACGSAKPSPGDFSLCLGCASLNVFDGNLHLRAPTPGEMLDAAANKGIQSLRRAILASKMEEKL
jgi:hypothetical protein